MIYFTEVGIIKGWNYYCPVDRIVRLPANIAKANEYRAGEEYIITHKYPNGIFPGVRLGSLPLLMESDLNWRTIPIYRISL